MTDTAAVSDRRRVIAVIDGNSLMHRALHAVKVGFANRQSFYAAFYKLNGITPRSYRINHLAKENNKA